SAGYPGAVRTGLPIAGLDDLEPGLLVFHAGTIRRADARPSRGWEALKRGLGHDGSPCDLLTSGGRVLTVVGTGVTLAEARRRAYRGAETVRFEGYQYRTDIGAVAEAPAPLAGRGSAVQESPEQ